MSDMQRACPTAISHDPQRLVTIPTAAARLGVGRRQLDRAIEKGLLHVYDLGGGWPRVKWTQVVEWIEGTRRGGALRSDTEQHQ